MQIDRASLTSGELARRTGVSADTLRHYEAKGVLQPPPRHGSYREYPPEAVDRVRTIRRALSIGFTLDELARLFAMRAAGRPPCRNAIALAESKLEQVQQRIEDLTRLKEEIARIIDGWRVRIETVPAGEPAGLLDSLAHVAASVDHHHRRRL